MLPTTFFKDPRYFQILFQSIFLSYGILFLHWQDENWLYVTYFITSLNTQILCEYFLGNKVKPYIQRIKNGIPSICISSFGLSLLLKTNQWQIAVFAAAISILSKYIIRFNGKHVFNPSALGIVTSMVLCKDCWISPGQWGSGFIVLASVCCFGFIIVTKVQKLSVSIVFLGLFSALLFARQIIYLQWPIDFFIQSISTGSLLLFSFFMITDPKTLPNHTVARNIWCAAIALVAFYLATFKFINGAPIYVLVFAQMLVPVLDKFFKAKKYEWKNIQKRSFSKEYSLKPLLQNQSFN